MKWEEVKGELHLEGLQIEQDFNGPALRGVEVMTIDKATMSGVVLFRVVLDGYSIHLQVPAKPKMVKRWRVTGIANGFEIKPKDYDSEELAKIYAADLENCKIDAVEIPEA